MKIKVYKLTSETGVGSFISSELKVFEPEIENAEVGEVFKIEVAEMEKEKLDNLPEFNGF